MPNSSSIFSKAIRELRIHLCQTSPASAGLRAFLTEQYPNLKKNHPHLPMLIRECQGVEARIFARYAFGRERKISLDNVSKQEVLPLLKQLNEPFEEDVVNDPTVSRKQSQIA